MGDTLSKEDTISPVEILDEAVEIYNELQKILVDRHATKNVASWSLASAMMDISALQALSVVVGDEEAKELYHAFSLTAPQAIEVAKARDPNVEDLEGPGPDDIIH